MRNLTNSMQIAKKEELFYVSEEMSLSKASHDLIAK